MMSLTWCVYQDSLFVGNTVVGTNDMEDTLG